VEDAVRREALARRIAQHLGVQERVFLRTVSKIAQRVRRSTPRAARPTAPTAPTARQAPNGTREGRRPEQPEYLDADAMVDFAVDEDDWASASPRATGSAGSPGPTGAPGPTGSGPTGSPWANPDAAEPEDGGSVSPSPQMGEADQVLLACLLSCPELLGEDVGLDVTLPAVREILDLFREGVSKGSLTRAQIVRYLFMRCAERPHLSQLVASCLDRAEHIKSPQETFSLLLKDRSAHATRHAAQHIRYRLQQARDHGDQAAVQRLTQEYLEQLRSRSAEQA
jgi:hypothetical protein